MILVADADDNSKNERHELLERALGSRFLKLPCREIENLISKEVLLAVVGDYEGDNAKLNDDFDTENYANEYLGQFIEKNVLSEKSKRNWKNSENLSGNDQNKGAYAIQSGTIKDKPAFQQKVLKHTRTYDDLSEMAKEFVKRLIGLIRKIS